MSTARSSFPLKLQLCTAAIRLDPVVHHGRSGNPALQSDWIQESTMAVLATLHPATRPCIRASKALQGPRGGQLLQGLQTGRSGHYCRKECPVTAPCFKVQNAEGLISILDFSLFARASPSFLLPQTDRYCYWTILQERFARSELRSPPGMMSANVPLW